MQLGWYLGGNEGATDGSYFPYSSTPRLIWGENQPGGEQLHTGTALSWNTYYVFEIKKTSSTGVYSVYLQGSLVASSQSLHSIGIPGFNGEVDLQCVTMLALASHANSPKRTLEYLNPVTNTWNYWDTTKFANSGFSSVSNGDIATDLAIGGGP
ncbi:MAG: hypothetical protein JWR52_940 [Marmoricola sp.]|nr:hypothetical protein [Marmoricola sp.]